MKNRLIVFIAMVFACSVICGVKTESKFQQYEQETIKPVKVSVFNYNMFAFAPFGYGGHQRAISGYYINPYYNTLVYPKNEPKYPLTTYTPTKEYGFNFSKSDKN